MARHGERQPLLKTVLLGALIKLINNFSGQAMRPGNAFGLIGLTHILLPPSSPCMNLFVPQFGAFLSELKLLYNVV